LTSGVELDFLVNNMLVVIIGGPPNSIVCISHWAVDVESGNGESGVEHNSMCSMFSVVITLTDEGLDQLCLVRFICFVFVLSDLQVNTLYNVTA